jgi:excinuclease ABC subunit C
LLLGIAKGPARKAGLEQLFLSNQHCLELSPTSTAFHLIQHIRNEAHRFAIKAHRKKLIKKSMQSSLERIPGIGKKRRQLLLNHFGGLQALKKANIDEIMQVNGISKALAKSIKIHLS